MAVRNDLVEIKVENQNNEEIKETKPTLTYRLLSLGKAIVDRRYTVQILQWVVREIAKSDNRSSQRDVNLSLEDGEIKIKTVQGHEEALSRSYSYESIIKLPRLKSQDKLLAFVSLGRNENDSCCCHAFECADNDSKIEILKHLKSRIMESQASAAEEVQAKKKLSPVASVRASHKRNLSYGGPVPQTKDDAVHRYSVFYVGKVTINQAQAPPEFVDTMLKIINNRETGGECKDKLRKTGKHRSVEKLVDDFRGTTSASRTTVPLGQGKKSQTNVEKRLRSASDGDERLPLYPNLDSKEGTNNGVLNSKKENNTSNKMFQDDISARVVTFQISMSSLMLFSAGNKQMLLEKKIREISFCTKGQERTDNFGFICREKNGHVLYLFQGESEHMVDTIMKAMKQAFSDALQASAHLTLCDTCPIQILSKLLTKFEGATLSEQQASLTEHLQCLNETEYSFIMNKYNAKQPENDCDKIALVVYLLRSVYDQRQKVHQHNFQGMGAHVPNYHHSLEERDRSRTFFEKAKKSLTNSFDNLLMRRQRSKTCFPNDALSVDTSVTSTLTADSKRCLSPNLPRSASADNVQQEKQRSRTFNSCPPTPEFQSNTKFVIPENEAESIKSEPIPIPEQ